MLAQLAARLCDMAVRAAACLEDEPAVAHAVGDRRVLAEGHEVEADKRREIRTDEATSGQMRRSSPEATRRCGRRRRRGTRRAVRCAGDALGGIGQVALCHGKEFAVQVPLILPENEERALEFIPARAASAELMSQERMAHVRAHAPRTWA